MQIAFHLGAHATDDGALLKVLHQNRATLGEQAIAVPGPEAYPDLLRMAARGFAGQPAPSGQERAALLSHLAPAPEAGPAPERLVLSFESFLGFAQDAAGVEGFYPAAEARARVLGDLFAGHDLQLFFCLRNPVTLLPALDLRRRARGLSGLTLSPDDLPAWSGLAAALRRALPGARLAFWCDEDAPVVWHRILRAVAGFDEASDLQGALDYPAAMLEADPEAARDLRAWFEARRPASDLERAKALRSRLAQMSPPPVVSAGLAGWTPGDIARVTAAYDEDCARIARMPGVSFVLPPGP
ncbi:hypothetical protein [Falsigemmobacter faecalis]|uniref:Sulfotransferase family protein n=1 Tax=Falsigemmobacter faecalis TaxID=2488730 RepID=A0A3P3DQ92_9RHOB|nr:hypothetical protein [Falsigemmobacter faecalis]RRH76427.1 hypothetical protein EG244_06645 [Falsigemmobacter faecalis]